MKKKILVCFGTRPEAIKMCALIIQLKQNNFNVAVCVTAQHRQMLDQVLDFFEVKPEYDLDIMAPNQTLNSLSGKIFMKIDSVLDDFKPDIVLVHGDTTTSSICAWAAFNKKILVGHVEAGLRTYNKFSPFPEEINRQLTGKLADFHFAPTETSRQNLIKENILEDNIIVTGNTVIDSLLWALEKTSNSYTNPTIEKLLKKIDFSKKIILLTGHRRENFGDGINNICKSLIEISKKSDVQIVYPVHLNPNIQIPVNDALGKYKNIHLIEPLDYPSFIWIMKKAYLILTDSGGIQEEAPSLGKPVLVLRETTERPEAVEAGTVKLVGTNIDHIVSNTLDLINNPELYLSMSQTTNPYGNGDANEKIIKYLIKKI